MKVEMRNIFSFEWKTLAKKSEQNMWSSFHLEKLWLLQPAPVQLWQRSWIAPTQLYQAAVSKYSV